MELYRAVRFYISLEVVFHKAVQIEEQTIASFRTCASDLTQSTPVEEEIGRHIDIVGADIDRFVRNGMFQLSIIVVKVSFVHCHSLIITFRRIFCLFHLIPHTHTRTQTHTYISMITLQISMITLQIATIFTTNHYQLNPLF